jgi:5-aminolevulinate synthase
MYGAQGAGVAEQQGVADKVDLIQGTLAKAFGVIGGYIAGSAELVDFVRSFGAGFIFTSALPPSIAAGALASIRHLRRHPEIRSVHQERAATLKRKLTGAGLPVMPSDSHIVPLLVGDAERCKLASDLLLQRHRIYVQPINYPTVPRGAERLRLTPTPLHTDVMMNDLVRALLDVWGALGLFRAAAE